MPLQVFLIYAALVVFVYLATDGFQNNAPFVFTLPVIVLGWFTLWTRMPGRKRLLTAVSFFTLAIALYSWSVFPKKLELSAMLICLSHIAYLLSFYRSLRKWWVALAVSTCLLVSLFLYGVFADLYRSIPALVFAMCATILLSTSSFIVAGSVWKNGSTMRYEERSALLRFFGTFFLLICNAALLVNQFARHTNTMVCYLNFTYYTSQFLLYFANERAF
ncbi:hypothetical protein ACQ4LE_005635 [Meloidogyne hapla]